MSPAGDVREFYDAFSKRVLRRDFEHVNLRIEAAKSLIGRHVRPGARVLEVGCGAGIVSRFLQDRGARVVSLDISPENVEVARAFAPRGEFHVMDICGDVSSLAAKGPFDAIVLTDVVEHLPPAQRPTALRSLESLLAPEGVVVLTYPSPEYQEHLRAHEPESLQVIDETIRLETLLTETSLVPACFESKDCWLRDQYCHLVLRRPSRHVTEETPVPAWRRLWLRVVDRAWRWKTAEMRRRFGGGDER